MSTVFINSALYRFRIHGDLIISLDYKPIRCLITANGTIFQPLGGQLTKKEKKNILKGPNTCDVLSANSTKLHQYIN